MYSYLFKGSSVITVLHELCIKSTVLCSGAVKPHQHGVMATWRKFRPGLACKRTSHTCMLLAQTVSLSAQSCLNSSWQRFNKVPETAFLLICFVCVAKQSKIFNTLQVQCAKTAASIISTLTPFIRSSTIWAPGNFRRQSQQEVARVPPPPFHPFTLHLVGSASLAHDTSVPQEGMIWI